MYGRALRWYALLNPHVPRFCSPFAMPRERGAPRSSPGWLARAPRKAMPGPSKERQAPLSLLVPHDGGSSTVRALLPPSSRSSLSPLSSRSVIPCFCLRPLSDCRTAWQRQVTCFPISCFFSRVYNHFGSLFFFLSPETVVQMQNNE